MSYELLSEAQRAVAQRVLAEEEAKRRHLVVSLSGAHAYGFPSPDSDLDLKAIHVAPTAELLGLAPARTTFDRMEVLDGVEVDYTSNELQMTLAGMLGGNGNYLERVLGRTALSASPLLEELRPLVRRSLSRRVHRHYRGFAVGLMRDAAQRGATAKHLLYVLRTALTGTHLLLTGELVVDLREHLERHHLQEARALIEAKRAGERTVLDDPTREGWLSRLQAVLDGLDAARERSVLPEEPTHAAELEAWLIEVRRRSW